MIYYLRLYFFQGIPFNCSEKEVINFFKPLPIDDIRFPKNKKGKPSGYAFVDFTTIEDVKSALRKDKLKIQGRYVELFPVNDSENPKQVDFDRRKWLKKVFNFFLYFIYKFSIMKIFTNYCLL